MEERTSSKGWSAEEAWLGKGLVGVLEEQGEGGGGRRGRWIREAAGGGGWRELERDPMIGGAPAPVTGAAAPAAGGQRTEEIIIGESGEGDK
jgi:hypothetical protein